MQNIHKFLAFLIFLPILLYREFIHKDDLLEEEDNLGLRGGIHLICHKYLSIFHLRFMRYVRNFKVINLHTILFLKLMEPQSDFLIFQLFSTH